MSQLCGMLKNPSIFRELRLWWQNWGGGIVPAFAGRGLAHLHDACRLWRWMRELLVRGKNTIDPDVIDPGGRSVEIAPWKEALPFYVSEDHESCYILTIKTNEKHYFSNLFWYRTLHVSDRFTVHHQEPNIVYTAIGICHTGYADSLLAESQHNGRTHSHDETNSRFS
jgi:hypothetical protein